VQVARVPPPTAASGEGAPTTRAEIERLFRHTGITTLAGVVVALCAWLLFHRHRPSMSVLAWALLIHGAQAATLGVLLALQETVRAAGVPFAVVNPSPLAARVLEVTGLRDALVAVPAPKP